MKKLSDLFFVSYGNKLDLNKMVLRSRADGGINFVGRSSQNHGVSGTVAEIEGLPPYKAGLITVALGGTKLLSSFVQEHPFYTAQNVAILEPRDEMNFAQKLFYCLAIRHNRFRYSAFGREANRTLRQLLVPDLSDIPTWANDGEVESPEKKAAAKSAGTVVALNPSEWREFSLSTLFELKKGRRLTKAKMVPGSVPFIGAIDKNNGVSCRVGQEPIHEGNTITVNYNGSVAEAFYQPVPFWASDDVNVLYPKFDMTPEIALFLCTLIRREKYRYNYGRKWHLERMEQSVIALPVTPAGAPDYAWIGNYVSSLPFTSQI